MGSLSRVQLAAALIEYDNDSPYTTERKFAKESAIMSSVNAQSPDKRRKPVRRDWTREREEQAEREREEDEQLEREQEQEREREMQRKEQPSPAPDFRRSSSPFLQNLHEPSSSSSSSIPNRASTSTPPPSSSTQPQPSPPATPRQVPVSQPKIIKPKAMSSQRNVSISGVLADMMDVQPVRIAAPPKAHVPPRPHSTQPLNSSSSLLDPIPMTIPLQPAAPQQSEVPPIPQSASSNSLSSTQASTIYTAAPIALFNVPSFDPRLSSSTKPAPPPKRRLSALLMSSKPKTPSPLAPQPPAEPIRPLSETLRESIAALPRSLGGEGPSHRSFGGRGRTASMGDWESLVLAHGGEAEGAGVGGGEFGGYAQRVRDVWVKPPSQELVQQGQVPTREDTAVEEDDGTVEFEGVYGVRPPPTTTDQPSRRLSIVVVPSPQEQDSPEFEEVHDPEELDERRRTSGATPESSWGRLSYDNGSRRPSSGFSFIDRVPLDDGGGDLDLRPMFRHDESGSNTPRSTAGDYNDRAIPFPSSSSNSRPLSPSTPFRGLDLELGDEERDHRPEGGRRTPGGSLWDEIGRTTPDLLSRNDQVGGGGGEVDVAAVARGGASRQSFRSSQYVAEDYDEDNEEEELVEEERWVPPPSHGRASRFDPKSQSISSRTGMTPVPPGGSDFGGDEEDQQRRASIEQQANDTGRRLPGKRGINNPKTRPSSLAHFGQTHRLSTTPTSSIFLPPVLVMPAPLDPSSNGAHHAPVRSNSTRGGFVQTDSIPLPASFSTRPPLVHSKSSSSFVAAAAALGVPQKRLSLAQKTFRASLVVDGKRGGEFMGGALEEGARGWELDEDAGLESVVGGAGLGGRGEDNYRGPGSLYGRSLMEVLEETKLALKSKQRVFAGDSRPAMFTRTKSSGSFNSQRPNSMAGSIHFNPTLPGGPASSTSPQSLHDLLSDEINPARPNTLLNPGDPNARPGMPKKRNSVFGIDELWEKETRQREAEEREEAERAEKRQEEQRVKVALEEEKKRLKLEKKQGKRRSRLSFIMSPGGSSSLLPPTSPNGSTQLAVDTPLPTSPSDTRISALPPTLALLEHSPSRPISQMLRRPTDDDSDSDWEAREEERGGDDLGSGQATRRTKKGRTSGAGGEDGEGRRTSGGLGIGTWFASSDEDEGGENGNSRRRRASPQPPVVTKTAAADDSSDDEVPLAAQYNLPSSRSFISVTKPPPSDDDDDSEEERPLAQILKEKRDRQASSATVPTLRTTSNSNQPPTGNDEDEDDVPLGLRTSSYQHQQHPSNEDDDLPLGLTQAQHLQQIYMAQQHQMAMMQQQQQMHEFQVRQSMMMGGGGGMLGMNGMGMGMGGMGMGGMGMAMPPPQGPRPEEKVDRWRRGVAGES